jgi:hypothetical protein
LRDICRVIRIAMRLVAQRYFRTQPRKLKKLLESKIPEKKSSGSDLRTIFKLSEIPPAE